MSEQAPHPMKHRLAELSQRAGNYTLLFLSFATVAATTFLQIPAKRTVLADYIVVPNWHMVVALKVWMFSAIPLILAILPVTELVDEDKLHIVGWVKFVANWIGMLLCVVGIIFFVAGISY